MSPLPLINLPSLQTQSVKNCMLSTSNRQTTAKWLPVTHHNSSDFLHIHSLCTWLKILALCLYFSLVALKLFFPIRWFGCKCFSARTILDGRWLTVGAVPLVGWTWESFRIKVRKERKYLGFYDKKSKVQASLHTKSKKSWGTFSDCTVDGEKYRNSFMETW